MRTQAIRCFLSVSIAAILVITLIVASDVSLSSVARALSTITALPALAVFACSGAFIVLSAVKWRMVMRALAGNDTPVSWWPCLFYTSLGAALSLVLTVHLSLAAARAAGARLHLGRSTAAGAGASLYEQSFDLLALPLFAVPALFAIAFGAGPWAWFSVCLVTIGVASFLIYLLAGRSGPILACFARQMARLSARFAAAAEFFEREKSRPILAQRFMLAMFLISVVRYLVLMLRAYLVLWAANMAIAGSDFLNAFPLVQLSQVIAITPGGLGISEWTWSGVLTWLGYPPESGVLFALVIRVANIASVSAWFFAIAIPATLLGGTKRIMMTMLRKGVI